MNTKTDKILELYFITNKLKGMLRSGWLIWHVEKTRVESIAEHIFGTIMLAVSICANENLDINLEKVALMLALHEIEEITIGDITLYDDEKLKTKEADGKKAVEEIFKNCENKQKFLNIIAEFEQNKTKEAKFAKMCDKMDADLQAYLYRDNFNYKKVPKKRYNHEVIKKLNIPNEKRAEALFLAQDKHYYDGIFLDIWQKIKELDDKGETK